MSDKPENLSFSRPGEVFFVAVFLALAVLLLSQLGVQTKFSAKGQLFAQPRFWPAVGVIGMTVFGALHLTTIIRKAEAARELREAVSWLRALEFLAWFMVYVLAVPRIGYLPATVAFTVLLALRMGYRRAGTLWAAAGTGLAIVVVFKTLLSVKIPGGAVYEYLPDGLRNFLILNF